jgi:hypothetical protein
MIVSYIYFIKINLLKKIPSMKIKKKCIHQLFAFFNSFIVFSCFFRG